MRLSWRMQKCCTNNGQYNTLVLQCVAVPQLCNTLYEGIKQKSPDVTGLRGRGLIILKIYEKSRDTLLQIIMFNFSVKRTSVDIKQSGGIYP